MFPVAFARRAAAETPFSPKESVTANVLIVFDAKTSL